MLHNLSPFQIHHRKADCEQSEDTTTAVQFHKRPFANIQVLTPLQMLVDLAIVGPGVLGSLVAEQYKSVNPSATISLVFRSENAERRDRLGVL